MSDSKITTTMTKIEKKLNFFVEKTAISLIIVIMLSLLIRMYYFPYGVPLTLDAFGYFSYATDTSILGHFPFGYNFPNNGWPALLAIFFSIFHFTNFLDYMTLERLLSVSISVLTIIPVYFLCHRFFNKTYSLLGASLFAFEPHIIQNSLLGITEPLYIVLVTISLYFLLSNNKKFVYASFGMTSLSAIVRYEGLVLFFVLSIIFFVRFRKEGKVIAKYLLAVGIFVLILLPMALVRIQTTGEDGLTSDLASGAHVVLKASTSEKSKLGLFQFAVTGFENLFKYLGWISLPFFVFFLPTGLYFIFRNRNQNNLTIIISLITLSIPALYAYAREIQDTRYLLVLIPLFCVISILTIQTIDNKMKNHKIFLILLVGGVLLSSTIYLDVKKYDYEHQREAFDIAKYVATIATGINSYSPESGYILDAELPQKWPALKLSISFNTAIIPTDNFDSLDRYIESSKNKGLSHLIVDGSINRPPFLNDVFYHEEKYPYLTKIYDSSDYGYKYHVKIYKIDYNIFDKKTKVQ